MDAAEVSLTRSLGYGTYVFVVRDVSLFEPARGLRASSRGMPIAGAQNHREMGIEISQWGDPANKNAQYVVQPYYMPANVARFARRRGG